MNKIEKRKLQKQNPMGYRIGLPKIYVEQLGWVNGDPLIVDIDVINNTMTIHQNITGDDE